MIYYDATNTSITDGLATLKAEAESPDATPSAIAYYELITAISKGEGFNWLCSTTRIFDLTKADLRGLLKELLYAIETERLTDRYTHKNIVDETMDNLLSIYA